MTPKQCEETARRCEAAAAAARKRLAVLAAVFGGSPELPHRAERDIQQAPHAAHASRPLAALHPPTRARPLRSPGLPPDMFGY